MLENMNIFVAVVDVGSFSGAAKKLGISIPVVSKRIKALEAELQTRLLFRTTRKISLSEAGEVFYQHCSRALAEADEARNAVNDLNAAPIGHLRVTVPVTLGNSLLPRAVPEFLSRYPDIMLEIDVNDRLVDLAEEGYDIAIRLTKSPPDLYVARKLSDTKRVVCASPSYWQQYGIPSVPESLLQHNCIQYSWRSVFNQWQFVKHGKTTEIETKGNLKTNNTQTMLQLAIGGAGVVMFTSVVVQHAIDAGQLVPVLRDYQSVGSPIYALTMSNRYLPKKSRVFIDYLSDWCKRNFV